MHIMPTRLSGKAVLLCLISSVAESACVTDACLVMEGTDETSLVQIRKTLSRPHSSKLSKVLDSSEDLQLSKTRRHKPKLAEEFEATTQAKANHQNVELTAKSSVAEHVDLEEEEEEGLQEGTEQADGSKKMWAGKSGTGPWAKFVEQALSSGKEWRKVLDDVPEVYQGRRRLGEVTARNMMTAEPVPVNQGGPMLPGGPPVAAPVGATLVNGPNMGYPVAAIGSTVASPMGSPMDPYMASMGAVTPPMGQPFPVAGGPVAGTPMGSPMASMGSIPEVRNEFAADDSEMTSDGVSAKTEWAPVTNILNAQLQPMANPVGGMYAGQNAVASAYAQAQQAAVNAATQAQEADNQMLAALSADETAQITQVAEMKNAQVMAALR